MNQPSPAPGTHPGLDRAALAGEPVWRSHAPTGVPVVFVHGFTGTGADAAPVVEAAARAGLGLDLIAPDVAGHGPLAPAPTTWAAEVARLRRVVQAHAAAVGAPPVLVGYSMGARLALAVACTGEPLGGLVLAGGSPGLDDEAARAARRAADEGLAADLEAQGVLPWLRAWDRNPLLAAPPDRPSAAPRRPDDWREGQQHRPQGLAAALRVLGTGAMPPLHEALAALELPVWCIAGRHDTKFVALAHSMARALPHGRFVEADAGHVVPVDDPHAVVRALADARSAAESPVPRSAAGAPGAGPVGSAPAAPDPPPSRLAVWVGAARVRTLPAAATPVVVGTAYAWQAGQAAWGPALAALVGATLLQLVSNFANDYYDFVRGADTADRVGPPRATSQGWVTPAAMKGAMVLALLASFAVGIYLVVAGGWPIVAVGLASMLAAWAYTGGPWPLAYHGLGDVFVFVFFGLVAVAGTWWVQAGVWAWGPLWLGVPVGALATAILVVNNLRDLRTDAAAGKRTLAVQGGARAARIEYSLLLASGWVTVTALAWAWQAPTLLLPWLALPLARTPWRRMLRDEGAALQPALGETARVLLVFGLLLAAGLAATRWTGGLP
jgi:1,4-dihydroxy-2-naphthoate octaprenyltransferase